MKLPPLPHRWTQSPRAAAALQRDLAVRLVQQVPNRPIRLVAGLDAAFSAEAGLAFGAVVLWDMERRQVVEERTAAAPLRFPYVPGLLSFREAPVLLRALRKLRLTPDALMCDGHGVAHPRRFGLACHLGLLCQFPSFGVAKSILVGEPDPLPPEQGASAPIRDRGEVVGLALRTRGHVRPVFLSVGHLLDLPTAAALALACVVGRRVPEPTRLADRLVARAKADYLAEGGGVGGCAGGSGGRTKAMSKRR